MLRSTRAVNITSYKGKVKICNNLMHFKISQLFKLQVSDLWFNC